MEIPSKFRPPEGLWNQRDVSSWLDFAVLSPHLQSWDLLPSPPERRWRTAQVVLLHTCLLSKSSSHRRKSGCPCGLVQFEEKIPTEVKSNKGDLLWEYLKNKKEVEFQGHPRTGAIIELGRRSAEVWSWLQGHSVDSRGKNEWIFTPKTSKIC